MPGTVPGPLDGTAWGEFAVIYRAAARLGFTPRQIDDCYPWEVAAMFGLHEREAAPAEKDRDARAMLRARVAAAEQGRAAPKWAEVRAHKPAGQ